MRGLFSLSVLGLFGGRGMWEGERGGREKKEKSFKFQCR